MATKMEIRAGARLLGDALAGTVRSIEHVHLAIAERAFNAAGPSTAAVRATHDIITKSVYAAVSGANALLPRVGALAATASRRPGGDATSTSWSESGGTALALAALNGLRGDSIAEQYPELALSMSIRDPARRIDVELTGGGVAAAFSDATHRLAVFVHGLCETDGSWQQEDAGPGVTSWSYGSALQADLGLTPLYVRYNTGRRVVDNGRSLAELLERVVHNWPVAVEEIVFIGHSMGGLVVRSACHEADNGGRDWAAIVRHVVCLGTPHLGAPLERGVDAAVRFFASVPEVQPLARFLNDRSAGIKDLRHGLTYDPDTDHPDADRPDADLLRNRRSEVPFLPGATYHFVAATVTRSRHHPVAGALGDLLVRYSSAAGEGRHRRIGFELEHGVHLGGLNHFQLLHHPAVYEQLRQWLASPEHAHSSHHDRNVGAA